MGTAGPAGAATYVFVYFQTPSGRFPAPRTATVPSARITTLIHSRSVSLLSASAATIDAITVKNNCASGFRYNSTDFTRATPDPKEPSWSSAHRSRQQSDHNV